MTIDNKPYLDGFAEHYANNACPVWDIGRPQKPFVEHADKIRGPILDIGCGTGSVAVYFASRGESVTALDFVDNAIERAKKKACEAHVNIDFMVKDFFTLESWGQQYESIIDSGLFHIFSGDEERKSTYLRIVTKLLRANGRLYLLATKKTTKDDSGISADEIRNTFNGALQVDTLQEFDAEVVQDSVQNIPGKTWVAFFAVIKKC